MSDSTPDPDKSTERYPPGWVPGDSGKPATRDGRNNWTIGLAVLAVVAVVAVGAILIFSNDPDSTPSTATSAAMPAPAPAEDSGAIASAGDVGPVAIVTSDVTCQSWRTIQSTLASAQSNGWEQRDASLPASSWTEVQRAQFEAVGSAMRTAGDDTVALARQTPHRVMRELYEQFIAYGRAYADSLTDYEEPDDFLARTNISAFQALSEICAAADSGAAISRGATVETVAPPSLPPAVGDPANPVRFLPESGPTCARWVPAEADLQTSVDTWLQLDPDVPLAQWSPAQQAVQQGVTVLFGNAAGTLETTGRGSGNELFEDFAVLAAQYFRAYVGAAPNFVPADRSLAMVGLRLDALVASACQAAGR